MAIDQPISHELKCYPMLHAGADLSASQYECVKMDTADGDVIVCDTLGERALGILQDAPSADGEACQVAYQGISQATIGASVTRYALLVVDATGRLITQADPDEQVVAIALGSGTVGQKISVLLCINGPSNSAVAERALASAKIWLGNASGEAAAVDVSGDVTISNTGVTTIGALKIENGMLENDVVTEDKVADSDGTSGLGICKHAVVHWDFAADGGTIGAIVLADSVTIPDNAVVELVNYDVITTCTSAGGDAGTLVVSLPTDGALSTAVAISDGSNPLDEGPHLGSVLTPIIVKTTAARAVGVTVATQNITAGKVSFYLRYWVSQ